MNDKSLYYKGFDAITEIDSFFDNLKEYAELNESGNSVYSSIIFVKHTNIHMNMKKRRLFLYPSTKCCFLTMEIMKKPSRSMWTSL